MLYQVRIYLDPGVDDFLHLLLALYTCVAWPTKPEKTWNIFRSIWLEPGFGENHPQTRRVAQYSDRSACVLRAEAPGRHTQTRTQASPAVAESKARLAIGFLVVDNSGPAAADSEFAASVMRQLRHPIRLCSRQMSRGGRPRRNRAGLLMYPRT